MASNAYADLAQEYYDPFHKTCRNFDAATKSALARKTFALPDAGLILEVGCGRGRCQEFLGVDKNRVVQLDSSREMRICRARVNLQFISKTATLPT
jgi:hypothetical protein